MRHVDPDELTLLALGERPEPGAADHLLGCGSCRREVEALRRTADLARETVDQREAVFPPASVWARIAAEIGISGHPTGGHPTGPNTAVPNPTGPNPTGPNTAGPNTAGPKTAGPNAGSGHPVGPNTVGPDTAGPDAAGGLEPDHWPAPDPVVVPLSRRAPRHRHPPRPWRRGMALVAAVAAGIAGTLGLLRPWAADPDPAPSSTAALAGPNGATGEAVVLRGPDGARLRVTARGLPLQQGYYEVWVYDGRRGMVSIGTLGADSTATLPLPPTLDLRRFHVVDVSQEPYDGDQTHSETSVLRGTLTDGPPTGPS